MTAETQLCPICQQPIDGHSHEYGPAETGMNHGVTVRYLPEEEKRPVTAETQARKIALGLSVGFNSAVAKERQQGHRKRMGGVSLGLVNALERMAFEAILSELSRYERVVSALEHLKSCHAMIDTPDGQESLSVGQWARAALSALEE